MKFMRKLILLCCIFLIPLTLASDTQHRFKVYVDVGGDDEQAVNTIESHLKRELRLLGDVDVVGKDNNWRYVLQVFVMALGTEDVVGQETYAIATYEGFRLAKIAYQEPFVYENLPSIVYPMSVLGVAKFPKRKLPQFCIEHVGSFDKRMLQSRR